MCTVHTCFVFSCPTHRIRLVALSTTIYYYPFKYQWIHDTHTYIHKHTHTRCYAQTHTQHTHTHTHTQVPSLRSILPSSTLFRPPMTTGESTAVYIHIHIYIHTYIHTREDTSSFTRTRKVARTPSLQSFSSSLLFMPCCRLEPQRERE